MAPLRLSTSVQIVSSDRESDSIISSDAGATGWSRRVWIWIGLGLALRLVVSGVSVGTNDATTWMRFGREIVRDGLLATYGADSELNHPPIPAYWAMIAARLTPFSSSPAVFAFVFKLPMIAADLLAAWVLWRIWTRRRGPAGAGVAAMFALSPIAILISGYHCNTEPLYVALCLVAVYCIEEGDRSFWGGFWLGAAINIKLIPVLLVPALLLGSRRRGDAIRFLLGMAPWVVPFLFPLLLSPGHFNANALQYSSTINRWGINFFLLLREPGFQRQVWGLADVYFVLGKFIVLTLIVAWSVLGTRPRRWDRYELAAVTFAIFLVFTSGFGIQYLALVGAPLFAVRPRLANAYAITAGIFACCVYGFWWAHGAPDRGVPAYSFPLQSISAGMFPIWCGLIGLVPWVILCRFVYLELAKSPGSLVASVTA